MRSSVPRHSFPLSSPSFHPRSFRVTTWIFRAGQRIMHKSRLIQGPRKSLEFKQTRGQPPASPPFRPPPSTPFFPLLSSLLLLRSFSLWLFPARAVSTSSPPPFPQHAKIPLNLRGFGRRIVRPEPRPLFRTEQYTPRMIFMRAEARLIPSPVVHLPPPPLHTPLFDFFLPRK